ncbi:MAG TPA: hypothetical protein VG756_17910 [Pseudonocardiaceae bacterium]|nr:hypothetical protein [Pseudonocardiaceae bacterium]
MQEVLTAAADAFGEKLSEPIDLGGSSRSTVLRCRTGSGTTVVVKAYRDEPEALACFTAEAAGLAFGTLGPHLLAVDVATPLIVMSDLGTAPSLADTLLGDTPDTARTALLAWASTYGALAAESIGRQPELSALRARYDRGRPDWDGAGWITGRIAALPEVLAALGVTGPAGLDEDLAVVASLTDDRHPVFSPGDICPDNNVLTASGPRVLDFEASGFHPVFLDAAYTRMPFSTCWCVFRLPDELSEATELAYRKEILSGYPELADDSLWRDGVLRAAAAWTLDITVHLTGRVLTEDRPMHSRRRPTPSARQLLRHRWRTLHAELTTADRLPALAELTDRLLTATHHWPVGQLPGYPAFRSLAKESP